MNTETNPTTKASHRMMWCVLLGLVLAACHTPETAKPILYEGPLSEAEDVTMYYSEKEVVKVLLKAKKIFEFQNGDREFPEGIYLEFYNEFGKISSTLKANSAYFFKEENKWRGRGAVEVVNLETQDQLNTEELFWKRDTKKIFTEKFVTIRRQNDVIYGTGLEADQDLSNYHITKPWDSEFEIKD